MSITPTNVHPAAHLMELVRQVRPLTMKWLLKPEDRHLMWAPQGLTNHVLWHAGHALWVVDVLGVAMLTGKSELPAGWAETFGMNCRPVPQTTSWPDRHEVHRLLGAQMERVLSLLEQADAIALTRRPRPDNERDVAGYLLHALHDEAKHQGEMHVLIKQWRAQNNWQPPA